MNTTCPCCGHHLLLSVTIEPGAAFERPMVATPAKCLKCNTVYDCPGNGRVMGPCGICGGELRTVAGLSPFKVT